MEEPMIQHFDKVVIGMSNGSVMHFSNATVTHLPGPDSPETVIVECDKSGIGKIELEYHSIDYISNNDDMVMELCKLLSDGLFPGSKDWTQSGLIGRVEWLLSMYDSKKEECEMLWTWMEDTSERIGELREKYERLKEKHYDPRWV